ncbi:MAG TPA: phosphoribosylanthranilate isomerase, partial [Xanthomonadaceae bacterium]|nr:phosphoribosylanthranilate isomerase [Xanthomonadaceae bacterium]
VRADEARAMRTALEPLVDAVAVFRDNPVDEVRETIRLVAPTVLQFHGAEDDAFCRGFGLPYIKGITIDDGPVENAMTLQMHYPGASAFLFDGPTPGNGVPFDWSRLPTGLGKPFMLAGGLRTGTVFDAIQTTLPWGVDASSGIEVAPGVKDGERMRRFVEEVRRADCHVDPDEEADRAPGVQSRP